MGKFRVLPDQLSGLAQCCNSFFFVGSGIKSDGYNFFQTIPIFAHSGDLTTLFGVPPAAWWRLGPQVVCRSAATAFSERYAARSSFRVDPDNFILGK